MPTGTWFSSEDLGELGFRLQEGRFLGTKGSACVHGYISSSSFCVDVNLTKE